MKIEAKNWQDYELIDAGGGYKYERFGQHYFVRPENLAYFKSGLRIVDWKKECDFSFEESKGQKGKWTNHSSKNKDWEIVYDDLKVQLSLTQFKHVGIFPEQEINWKFIKEYLKAEGKFLNLFGYTGLASIVAAKTGAKVIHVDSIKQIVKWASKNAELNNLDSISWVVEDALKFARKEFKRGRKYNGIIMDPPAFGFGPKGEKWKIEDNIEELIQLGVDLLDSKGFFILNTYSPKLPMRRLQEILESFQNEGQFEVAELFSTTSTGKTLSRGNLVRFIKS
jgi:23S rRNA (cytosine1962-C5)-methyltransferase